MGLLFKRSVIENIPVDIEQAKQVVNIINNLVLASQVRDIPVNQIAKDGLIMEDKKKTQESCVHCGQNLEGGKFCTSCGNPV